MKVSRKLLALLLTVLMLFSSIGCITVLAEEVTEPTAPTITESATQFLYDQAYNGAIAEGATAPTKGNSKIAITQTGPWRVAGKRPDGASYNDVGYYWFRSESASALDMRYGYSDWSYTTPFIGPALKVGDTSKKVLSAQLRPNTTADSDRKNAFMELYYIAETAGEFNISDGTGGFTVRSSGASNYEVYVTVLANGTEIFKSQALTRVNRIARFADQKVTLNKGDKLEYRFEYITLADTFSGDIVIDFDPVVTLIKETEVTAEPQAMGDVSEWMYNQIYAHYKANETIGWQKVTQTGPWRMQYGSGTDMTYCKISESGVTSSWLDYRYGYGAHDSQHTSMAVAYYNSKTSNPKIIRTNIYFKKNLRTARITYTAEETGEYTLYDRFGTISQITGTLVYYEVYPVVYVNGKSIWKSETGLRTVGDSVKFEPITVRLEKGETLSIGYEYSVRKDLAEGVTAETGGQMRYIFAPMISYLPAVESEEYSAKDSFNDIFADVIANTTENSSGTLTQPASGWTFKYGTSVSSLTAATKYSINPDGSWGEIRLHANTTASGDWPSIKFRTGTSSKYGLVVHYRNRMSGGSINSNGYHYNFAYVFTATRQGIHVLDESTFGYSSLYSNKIDGVLKIYKNGELLYTSAEIDATTTSTVIPEMTMMLNVGDELIFYFERLDSDTTLGYNVNSAYSYEPTITYHKNGVEAEKKGYTPTTATRYYAEGQTVPTSVSAYINTTSAIPGYIVNSNAFALSVAPNGNPTVTYKNGDVNKQIVFPVNVKGGWKKLSVAYDTAAKKWNCLVNDINVASVEDADFVAGGAIEKLYIGASADSYNNELFKGEIAELTFGDTTWTLEDVTAETGLKSETLKVQTDCSETFLRFKNKNSRYDLYEDFATPVATYEAWIRVPTEYADDRSAGSLISSGLNHRPYARLTIEAGGKPTLAVTADKDAGSVSFNTDVRSDDFVHLAITNDAATGTYKCYINGILVDTQVSDMVIPVTANPYLVSGDYYQNNASVNFEGDVAGVAMFSDVRTAEEILADMYGGTDLTDTALFGKWSFADTEQGLINQNGNGNDFHPLWESSADETVDESYGNYSTFIFIPDTQNFTQTQHAAGIAKITNWILDNKEKENIVGVIGLGDITNRGNDEQFLDAQKGFLGYYYDSETGEKVAYSETEGLIGNVPYLFVQGNHDINNAYTDANGNKVYRNTSTFNKYYAFDDLQDYFDGYFEEGKVDNIYILTEDDKGVKYMFLGLEFQPRDEVLAWANEVVAAHPDYNVIVSTHGYQDYDHATNTQEYIVGDSYPSLVGPNNNRGDQIWEKFVKNHANIITVACGHVYQEDIHVTTKTGVNGNIVTEIIANGQTTDSPMWESGLIMIVRVSEDGTKANVNYYSPANKTYLKDLNQFEMDWNLIEVEEDEVANIGGESFSSLQEAFDAADENAVVEITADIEATDVINIDKAVTIKLATDKVITANGAIFNITANTVITGDGAITSLDGSNPFTVAEGVTLEIKGGVFTGFNPATADLDYVAEGFGVKVDADTFIVEACEKVADLDDDGNLTISDIAAVRDHMLGVVENAYRDVNGDGKYDARDIVRSKRLLARF